MQEALFVGTWRLASFELRNTQGEVSYPLGEDAVGFIMYANDGRMSVEIMSAERPVFALDDVLAGSAEEKAAAFESYISYCGRYEVRGATVVHHVEVGLFPNWVGGEQERIFEFSGNRLMLSTGVRMIRGHEQSAHLIWERVA